jgi:hypothetical protein
MSLYSRRDAMFSCLVVLVRLSPILEHLRACIAELPIIKVV